MPADVVRKHVGKNRLIGMSTHALEEAREAERNGADFILFGPIFYTASKARYGDPLGLNALRDVAETLKIPVFAVGGIDPDRATQCRQHGAWGVAAISSIMQAVDIDSTVQKFRNALDHL